MQTTRKNLKLLSIVVFFTIVMFKSKKKERLRWQKIEIMIQIITKT